MRAVQVDAEILEFEGLSPTGNARRLFHLPIRRLFSHFDETNNRSMLAEGWLIPDVCDTPAGIWRGLNRSGQDEALCYAGIPMGVFANEHKQVVTIPFGKVFLVFMTSQLEITKWRFCEQDPARAGFPVGHATRFGELLWPRD